MKPGWLALGVLLLAMESLAAARLETIAGTGVKGFSGDGGPAVSAQVNDPYGVTVGPDGAIYFCDMGNHRVRRIGADGMISTVAGNGTKGYAGDGGAATEASLNEPYEVRFDRDGNLFFVEMRNDLVRRVDVKTKIISTVVKGFKQPHSIQFAPNGDLFICDTGNHLLRRLEVGSGKLETVVTEGLRGPRATDFDARGNLWLALREGNAIYRFDAKGAAHREAEKLAGPKGLTISRGGLVIWADTESHSVKYLDPRTGKIELLAGDLKRPHGVFVDARDVLYIGDSENHRVLKMELPEAFRRAHWLAQMEKVMGAFPPRNARGPLKVEVSETVDVGEYERKLLTYESSPGEPVPGYLLTPKMRGDAKPIGVLALHQTRPEGHKVVVGLAGRPEDEYGVELVKRGFVVLAPSYPHLANYAPDLSNYESGTMKAIWDNVRGLDLLMEFAGADPEKFVAIGHSLGGHNSLYTAAFDERIKVAVTSCGFDSFRDYMNGNIKGWTSHRYMPKLLEFAPDKYPFDFDLVLAAIGPRAVFVSAPKGDSNFKWESVDRVVARAEELQPGLKIAVEHPDAAHSFPKEMREAAYRFIDEALAR